jgi:hypothetical protein
MRHVFIITAIFLVFTCSCKKSSTSLNSEFDPEQLEYSAEDSIEAFELALWYEGNFLPSKTTIKNMLFSINYLRYTFGNTIPVLYQNRFMPPWKIGQLVVGFDDSTAALVRNHQYDGWNQLEAHLRPDTLLHYPDDLGHALLGFDEPYNPLYLSELYESLPGIEWCEPNGIGFAGGTFPIFPGYIQNAMSFIFVENYSYIPSKYYYFKYIENEPIFVGVNDLSDQINPDWWQEASGNLHQFGTWQGP